MNLIILIILLALLFAIFLFIRKDKDQIVESFSLGDFLHQNNLDNKDTTIINKINDFFETNNDDSGDETDDGDGGE